MPRSLRELSPGLPIHVVARCNNREPFPIPPDQAWSIFSDYLHLINGVFGIRILLFVMMGNHLHMILVDPEMNLSKALQVFMQQTSLEMARLSGRINKIWGGTFYSSVIESHVHFLHAYKYCYRNPVAAGIADRVEKYPWSTLQILLGLRAGNIPLERDETLFSDVEKAIAWLNESYREDEALAIKRALRKSRFWIASSESHRRNPLNDSSSLPSNFFPTR